jgi:hypothetical protein
MAIELFGYSVRTVLVDNFGIHAVLDFDPAVLNSVKPRPTKVSPENMSRPHRLLHTDMLDLDKKVTEEHEICIVNKKDNIKDMRKSKKKSLNTGGLKIKKAAKKSPEEPHSCADPSQALLC